MEASTNNSTSRWIEGIPYEVAFWNNVYRWRWTFHGMMGWSHYGSVIELEGFDANSYLAETEEPKVLDVGCGMSYATGNFLKDNEQLRPIEIEYVDPLAYYFNRILHRYHRQLPLIRFGMMEYLSAFYPKKDIDLVIIQNALDHSSNPVKGIMEALDVLKVGGYLYLNHHPNEAETEHYKGFHQYNICCERDKLIIWNKKEHWDICAMTEDFVNIQVIEMPNRHIVAILRKTAQVPSNMLQNKEDSAILCQQLLNQIIASNSLWYVLKMRLKYLTYNVIQFCVQALPWNIKMGLKRLIKQT